MQEFNLVNPTETPKTKKVTGAFKTSSFTQATYEIPEQDQSRISLKTTKSGYQVNEQMIAKIDGLEKEVIKKRFELQIVRKDLHTHLEREQKEKLIHEIQKYGDTAVFELIKAFKGNQ